MAIGCLLPERFVRKLVFILFIFLPGVLLVNGQNAKQHFKAGEQFMQNGMVDAALEAYMKSINLDPGDGKTYAAIASIQLSLGDTASAAENLQRAAALDYDAVENYYSSANLYYLLNDDVKALACLDKGLAIKSKDIDLLLLKTKLVFEQGVYADAYQLSAEAIKAKDLALCYYYHGASAYHIGFLEEAEQNLEKAIIRDDKLAEAYLAIARLQIDKGRYDYAIDNCSMVLLLIDPESIDALVLRSEAFYHSNEPDDAISDITKAIGLGGDRVDLVARRAKINLEYALYADAIHDYSIVLSHDEDNLNALENRAHSYAQLGEKGNSLIDYKYLLLQLETQQAPATTIDSTKAIIFELGKENQKPILKLAQPLVNENLELRVKEDETEIIVSGSVMEPSELKELKINNQSITFQQADENEYLFSHTLPTENLDFISITVVDLYDNMSTESYAISYIETIGPRVELISPIAGSADVIQLETDDNTLYIEGRVFDKSNITAIKIDEVNASFTPGDYNPKFTATINVQNRNNITVTAIDAFGNETKKTYEFAKDGYLLSDNNPMGKTWVVIIENSEYQEYTNLLGPARDVELLTKAFSRYQISKVLRKKNMTKRELERFFAIDLRDLIISNNVNSLLIWYAGHGQNINDIGYWIPVDGRQSDEYSFFNINALKASLYSYQTLTHTLVVSDACHAGEGFTIAMRGANNSNATCNDVNLVSQKSALVLTSSYQEAALDNSLFTRTFANALENNPADCIPIDAIADRVSIVMYKNTAQKPVFGRITGLEDKSGTFFFVTK